MQVSEKAIIDLIEQRFPSLSPRLRAAARFVLDNPQEIALHSMRSAAATAHIHPSSMQRLARELGFESYESFRDRFRQHVTGGEGGSWTMRARSLRERFSLQRASVSSRRSSRMSSTISNRPSAPISMTALSAPST